MKDQETLTLPVSGKPVIIKGYVSGLIDQQVQEILATANKTHYEVDASKVDINDTTNNAPEGTKVVVDSDPTAPLRADQKLLELMLVAVDGNNGAGLYEALLALPKADVDFVMAKVKELQNASEVKASDPKVPTS
jgi:hypothetical protein